MRDNVMYQNLNERFDRRYKRLIEAGYIATNAISESVTVPILKRPGYSSKYVTHSELLWKPLEAFEVHEQQIIRE